MNRMPVAMFSHRAKAEPVQQRLAQAGIPAEIHDKLRMEKLWFVSKPEAGVRIEVPAELFEKAEKQLLDWDAAEGLGLLREAIRCPECRSLRVEYPQFARNSIMTNLGMGLAAEMGLVERDFYCEDCHFAWPREGTRPRRQRQHTAPYYFIEGIALREAPNSNIQHPNSESKP